MFTFFYSSTTNTLAYFGGESAAKEKRAFDKIFTWSKSCDDSMSSSAWCDVVRLTVTPLPLADGSSKKLFVTDGIVS